MRAWLCALAVAALPVVADEVPYVQTPQPVVEAMLELAGVRSGDFVIDLGSGDGRIPITAAVKYGARGLGIDYDTYLVEESNANAAKAGVADRVRFVKADLFEADLRAASVVTMYLLPEFNLRLRPKLLAELAPGARIVSHDWDMGDWPPEAKLVVDAPGKTIGLKPVSTLFLWIVPAWIAGKWESRVPAGDAAMDLELEFEQTLARIGGRARSAGAARPIEQGAVRGRQVSFRVDDPRGPVRFEGNADADRIVGQIHTADGRTHPWFAQRVN